MKKLLLRFVGMLLAITMTMSCTVNTLAAAKKRYIKEIKLCYAESYEKAKELMGSSYTVVNKSLTENSYSDDKEHPNGKQNVWVGYTTTTKSDEAITDIAAMNMNGEFDENGYDAIVANYRDMVQEEVDALQGMIAEYRTNYNAEEEAGETGRAHACYELLTYYLDDDCLDEDEEPMSLADVFLDKTLATDEHLTDVLVQANANMILNFENVLAYSQNTGTTTWIKILQDITYDTLFAQYQKNNRNLTTKSAVERALDQEYSEDISLLYSKWEELYTGLKAYEESGLDENSTEEEVAEAAETASERVASMTYDSIGVALEKLEYNGKTLFDYFYVTADEMFENKREYYPILAALSAGEICSLRNNDLSTLLMNGLSENVNWENVEKSIETLEEDPITVAAVDVATYAEGEEDEEDPILEVITYQVGKTEDDVDEYTMGEDSDVEIEQEVIDVYETEPTSIFEGVNREFYAGGVAMTKEAVDKMTLSGTMPDTSEEDTIASWGKVIGLSVGAGVALIGGVAATIMAKRFASVAASATTSLKTATSKLIKTINGTNFFKNVVGGTGKYALSSASSAMSEISTVLAYAQNEQLSLISKSVLDDTAKILGKTPEQLAKMSSTELKQLSTQVSNEYTRITTKAGEVQELESTATKASKGFTISRAVAIGLYVVFIVLTIWDIVEITKTLDEIEEQEAAEKNAAYTYDRDIPSLMVWARDTVEEDEEGNQETLTDYIMYEAVTTVEKETDGSDTEANRKKNNGTNADIYAWTQKQWVALYTTTSWAAGDPILADSLVTYLGGGTPEDSTGAVHLFGDNQATALNLQDASLLRLVEKDGNNGFKLFFKSSPVSASGMLSVFSENTLAISLSAFGVLVLLGGAIVWLKKRKKATAVGK